MAKPSITQEKLKWADSSITDPGSGEANKVTTPTTKETNGWIYQEEPGFNYLNYWMNLAYQYVAWIVAEPLEGNYKFSGTKTFEEELYIETWSEVQQGYQSFSKLVDDIGIISTYYTNPGGTASLIDLFQLSAGTVHYYKHTFLNEVEAATGIKITGGDLVIEKSTTPTILLNHTGAGREVYIENTGTTSRWLAGGSTPNPAFEVTNATADITIHNEATFNDIVTLKENVFAEKDLNADNDVIAQNDVYAYGNVTARYNLIAQGSANIQNEVTCGNVDARNDVQAGKDLLSVRDVKAVGGFVIGLNGVVTKLAEFTGAGAPTDAQCVTELESAGAISVAEGFVGLMENDSTKVVYMAVKNTVGDWYQTALTKTL